MRSNLLRKVLFLAICMLHFSCSEEEEMSAFDTSNLVGLIYQNAHHRVAFVSADSLLYTTTVCRDSSMHYLLPYSLSGNALSFSLTDTIRINYSNPILGIESCVFRYYAGHFKGYFQNLHELSGNEIYNGYQSYAEEGYYVGITESISRNNILKKEK